MNTATNRPVKTFRIGSVSATIWKRERTDGQGHFYSAEIARNYKDGEEWQKSASFTHDELLNVAELAKRAEHWIAEQQS